MRQILFGFLLIIFLPLTSFANEWTIEIENTTKFTAIYMIYTVDHNFKDYNKPINIAGGEIKPVEWRIKENRGFIPFKILENTWKIIINLPCLNKDCISIIKEY